MAVTNKQCINRLQKEYKALLKEPVAQITAHPSPANILEWHFVLEGSKGSEYEGGVYHGKLVFPPQYPFKPPSISLFTPNGRFATNTKLCLSITDYHPESWNPMWSVGTILNGLLSFMYDNQPTTGSITTTAADKKKMAKESLAYNAKNPMFRKVFPEWCAEHSRRVELANQEAAEAKEKAASTAPVAARVQDNQPQGHMPGTSFLTVVVVVAVVAIAVVPLFSANAKAALALLGASQGG